MESETHEVGENSSDWHAAYRGIVELGERHPYAAECGGFAVLSSKSLWGPLSTPIQVRSLLQTLLFPADY